ncbi:MAG: hypothetical protein IJ158_00330 [Treponema sp.]|nr:hypothetical protein [Treponema sp.]
MNYTDKLQRLYERRTDPTVSMESMIGDSLDKSFVTFSNKSENAKAQEYIQTAMMPLSERSTQISFEEGERVKKHLQEGLDERGMDITFEYQGSVTCNTHIKGASDIDLLVITEKFYSLEPPLKPSNPYKGSPTSDMQELRDTCYEILQEAYPVAKIENKGAKSIKIRGGSLRRDIDVVPANWFDSVLYDKYKYDYLRGVQVFDKQTKERTANFPFYNRYLVEQKDNKCQGLYRGLVRLGKTIREDSDNKLVNGISSYDIQALFYSMPDNYYQNMNSNKILLVATSFLDELIKNPNGFANIKVPDGTRKIADKVSLAQLKAFYEEFLELSRFV